MRILASLLLVLTGCTLYFGDEDPPPCNGGPAPGGAAAMNLRNPDTGECEPFGGGGWCDTSCGPCAAELTPIPDWGYCESACDALDETTCLGASGCYAAYEDGPAVEPWPLPPSMTTFLGCRAVAQSGPIQGGSCWSLDAHECSRHDDCSLFYTSDPSTNGHAFSFCAAEPTTTPTCGSIDCGPGYRCEDQCHPCDGQNGPCDPYCYPTCVPETPNACAAVDCQPGYECVEICNGGSMTAGGNTVPAQCTVQCVPSGGGDPGQCTGPVLCDALPPACPANTVPGRQNGCWTGYCIPQSACGPTDPGSCDDSTVACRALPPACPAGTVPGVTNSCWSGYCIPEHACPVPMCESLTDEQACTARPECSPVYTGGDCTCTPYGCTCELLTFARCETSPGTPMPL